MCPSGSPVLQYTVKNTADSSSVLVSGHVTDGIGKSTVVFTGAIVHAVLTDSNGNFSFTATPAFKGLVSATAYDLVNTASNNQKAVVADKPPEFAEFTITEGLNHVWTFAGTVTDVNDDFSDITVTFSGLSCLTNVWTNVDSEGDFSIGVLIPAGSSGTIIATATDAWGLAGEAYTTI